MPYVPHTEEDLMRMLTVLGPDYLEGLKNIIPPELRQTVPLKLPAGLSEQELTTLLGQMASENNPVGELSSFLGAGAYNHYTPSIVSHLAGRSEFFTSYTPYQPEASQGTLQAIYEYQTLICLLTGMDVSNASLYDGASATAEAVLMARRIKKGGKVLVSRALHPEYRATIETYMRLNKDDIIEVPFNLDTGKTEIKSIEGLLKGEKAACVVLQSPNFFGVIDEVVESSKAAHTAGGLSVIVVNEPLSMALLKPPSALDADIVVGEARSFGSPLSFGGPYLGFMATKDKYLRQMPGRIVGQTVDKNKKRAFCLTLATREQHIRRESATSNICTNEGLNALQAAIYMVSLGRAGLMELARVNFSRSEYLKDRLHRSRVIRPAFESFTFNEFTFRTKRGLKNSEEILAHARAAGIVGGLDLGTHYPELEGHILIAATEMNSKEDIDYYAATIKELAED